METTPLDQPITQEPEMNESVGRENKNNTWKIVLLVLLLGFVVVACTLVTELFLLPIVRPMFGQEATPTYTPVPTQDRGGMQEDTPEPTEVMEPTEEPAASACSETGTMSFLILGVDMPYSDEPKGADAIRLMQLDFSTMEATMIAVPRDLWVSTPALNDQNIFSNRIGLTYYYAKEDAPFGEDEVVYASTMLAQTLYDNFGFVPDHYITLHLDKFDDIVDALGGVTVDVPWEYESVSYVYSTGSVLMNGDQALEYASNLINDDTIWERLERQELVIDAITEKITSPSVITKIPALISEFDSAITTDLEVDDLIDFSCLATDMTMSDVQVIELDSPYVSEQADSPVLQPDDDLIIELFEDVFD